MSVIFHSKKITIIFQVLLLIFNSHFILAQTEIDMSPSKAFQEAEYFFLYEEYKEALPLYMEALSANPANANFNYRVGQCLLNIEGMESKAISYFLTATVNVSKKYKEGSFKEKNAPVA